MKFLFTLIYKLFIFTLASVATAIAAAILSIVLIFASKNILYTSFVTYENPVNRGHSGYGISDKDLIKDISEWAEKNESPSIYRVHKKALEITSKKLSFSLSASSSMDAMYKSEKANCVGYSRLYCSAFNSITKELGVREQYNCSHMVAEIHLMNYNLHDLFTSRSLKNHDFNVIKDSKGKIVLATDPSLYDYSYISAANIVEK